MEKITANEVQEFEIEHLSTLRALAPECMVLLKKNGDFPLSVPGSIALYGSGARQTIKGGTGSGDVNVRHFTTVEEGLENAGFTITTKEWLDGYDTAKAESFQGFKDEVKRQAAAEGKPAFLVGLGKSPAEPSYDLPLDGAGDVCVYVLTRNSGEGADRPGREGDLLLSSDERRDILACAEKYQKFLLVLNVGGPVDISPVLGKVENILLLSQLGSVTGDAFADVLLGKVSPSGRLTSTWAKAEDYPAIGDFAEPDDTRYREGIFVGYRYFDAAGVKPLFPFGFGLSYTEFDVTPGTFRVEKGTIKADLTVKNTGAFAGKETVQLWYSAPTGRLSKPVRELAAYAKTNTLAPGASETLTLELLVEDMASWDEMAAAWVLEKGQYQISIGEEPIGIVSLDAGVMTAKTGHVCGTADFADWTPEQRERTVSADIPVISLNAAELEGKGHFDTRRIPDEALSVPNLSGFTADELAHVCTGKFKAAQGIEGIIGNAAFAVAGAAGETADVVRDQGFGSMVLADGPAGLRLATRYIERDTGAEGLDGGSFETLIDLFDESIQQLIRAKNAAAQEAAKTQPVYHHYASAIPIGTALAQSWNPALVERCGTIVGDEMERFGVNVWLAPALNIHRSPLCGRNFEYYSEDPLISGRTAAAMTRGVQAHKNCAVTIKHFCCNNQETNRFGSNSILSQRALREIYLKGFEICVKESAPKSVMTSYNLLNGIHTANRRDLLMDVLRDEWGFVGFVMTDWGTTGNGLNLGKHGASSPALCIKAGNDLIMSGNQGDIDGILSGLESGEITRADLEACAGRVLAMSKRLSG